MATNLAERLLDRVRMELGDLSHPFDFQFAGDGVRDHWNIEHRPVDTESLTFLQNGVEVPDPTSAGITVDHDAGVVVFDTAPPAGEVWEVQGMKWRYFTDTDLQVFLDTAMAQHSHNRGDSSGSEWTFGDLKPVEEYPVALLASIQALWALATDAAFDIDIIAPDGVNIPRSERYRQLMEVIEARQRQYDEIAAALNIGIKRLETVTVRRIAKNTNRLVPVYMPKEFDDHTRPKRILYPPLLQGTQPVKTNIETYDIDIVSGDPFSVQLDFEFDLTDCIIKNAIRRAPMSSRSTTITRPVREFEQTIIDAPNGILELSLSGKDTRWLPYNSYWEIQVQKPGEEEPRTYMRGLVRATNNEVVR
jgi:hypothetical protein